MRQDIRAVVLHPTVLAATILTLGMLVSAAVVASCIGSLDHTISTLPLGAVPSPSNLRVDLGGADLRVRLMNDPQYGTLLVKQQQ